MPIRKKKDIFIIFWNRNLLASSSLGHMCLLMYAGPVQLRSASKIKSSWVMRPNKILNLFFFLTQPNVYASQLAAPKVIHAIFPLCWGFNCHSELVGMTSTANVKKKKMFVPQYMRTNLRLRHMHKSIFVVFCYRRPANSILSIIASCHPACGQHLLFL